MNEVGVNIAPNHLQEAIMKMKEMYFISTKIIENTRKIAIKK